MLTPQSPQNHFEAGLTSGGYSLLAISRDLLISANATVETESNFDFQVNRI
jgi:hypothetical protein